jgi:hypothetical protein
VSAGSAPTAATSRGFGTDNYINSPDVFDLYWGAGTNNSLGTGQPMFLAGLFDLPFVTSPPHQVRQPNSRFTNTVVVPPFGASVEYRAFVLSNFTSLTNRSIQVVFVPVDQDTNILATDVRFFAGGPSSQAIVQWAAPAVDVITGNAFTNFVYLLDSTGVNQTNVGIGTNLLVQTFRPIAYEVTRATPFEWLFSSPTNFPYDNDLLDSPFYTSNRVSLSYSAYSAQVGEQFALSGGGPVGNVTNAPGRIEVRANELDLTEARIFADKFLSITATNVTGINRYAFDSPVVALNLRTTNQTLNLDNVGPDSVRRLNGRVSVWSGFWTNQILEVGVGVTNRVTIDFAVTIVYPEFDVVRPIQFSEFQLQGNNVVMNDVLNLPQNVVFDVKCLTIGSNSSLSFIQDFTSQQIPALMCLTNFGIVSVGNLAVFGPDQTASPLKEFYNGGIISAGSVAVSATNFINRGDAAADYGGDMSSLVGPLTLRFVDGIISEARFSALGAVGSVDIGGRSLDISSSILNAQASLIFALTNLLTDGGAGSSNFWTAADGFQFLTKPAVGDLLGTTITSAIPQFRASDHVLAAQDRGASPTGYVNNIALGRLVLNGANLALFNFRGVGVSNAIYIDYLEFQNFATNYEQAISIEPGCVVYFADANIPAEKLDGAFSGRLRWVKDYVGAFSSVEVPLTGGGTIFVNRALRDSSAIDSDADGIPNKFDSFPFDPPYVALTLGSTPSLAGLGGPNVAQISWQAAANTTYRIECKTKVDGQWQFLMNYTHGPKNGTATVTDSINSAGSCFYRVTYFR